MASLARLHPSPKPNQNTLPPPLRPINLSRDPICPETGDHVHYPPTRLTKPTPAPSPNLDSIFQLTHTPLYGECRKNQAAGIGTTAYDGCGEFVSATSSLSCGACGCHRSFHRAEPPKTILELLKVSSDQFRQIFCSPYGDGRILGNKRIRSDRGEEEAEKVKRKVKRINTTFTEEQTQKMRDYAEKLRWKLSSESREEVEGFCIRNGVTLKNLRVWMNNHNGGGLVKRFKTKFSGEQTEKMRNYAEKLRWKVSPESREEIDGFCIEIGVSRKSFVIWMNNHKEKDS